MKKRLSSEYSFLEKIIHVVVIVCALSMGVFVWYSSGNILFLCFFIIVFLLFAFTSRTDLAFKVKRNVFFDNENIYLNSNPIPVRDISEIDVVVFPSYNGYYKISFKNNIEEPIYILNVAKLNLFNNLGKVFSSDYIFQESKEILELRKLLN